MESTHACRRSGPPPRRWGETLIAGLLLLAALVSILAVVLIGLFLLVNGLPAFRYVSVGSFFSTGWYPLSGRFGSLPLVLGSLLVTAIALLIAVPLGVAGAIYLAEVAPARVREVLKPGVELLAAIPSVVVGFVGLMVLAPVIRAAFHLDTGLTALTGGIALAFMALPTIVTISEDAITAVPNTYREASLALGATHWQTITGAVLPAARAGVAAAIMLGLGRAMGETMAVLMITGNAAVIPHSVLDPVRTMTATLAAEMGEAVVGSPHYYALFMVGVVLFTITFLVNLVADLVVAGRAR